MAGIIEVKDQGKVRIYDADNSNYIDIVVPSTVSSNRTITLPDSSFTVPTANTVYTHPNHSGEVTSSADGATVIADNIVDEANLKVSNTPTNGYMLTAQSGNTGGLTWAAATAPGWVKIGDTVTCSTNTASVDFDNLSSDYSMYVVIGTLIRPETTASRLAMNFGTDGSSYAAAKTSIYSEEYANEGGSDHSGIAINNTYSLDNDTGDQNISSGLSNHGSYGRAGTMIAWLTGLGQGGNYASYMVNVNGFSNDNYAKWARANGQIQATADCVRFKFHQHGIAAGNFTLFGVTQ